MLGGRLLGQYNGVTTQFYLTDALGSVVSTFEDTAGSAVILGNQAYGPYGNKIYSAGSMGTNKGYTGQYQDVTGLDYYNARYYDSVIGRFVSADLVQGNTNGMDPYDYVGGNPETATDSTGQRIDFGGGQTATINPTNQNVTFFTPSTNGGQPTINTYTPLQLAHPDPIWWFTRPEWYSPPPWLYPTHSAKNSNTGSNNNPQSPSCSGVASAASDCFTQVGSAQTQGYVHHPVVVGGVTYMVPSSVTGPPADFCTNPTVCASDTVDGSKGQEESLNPQFCSSGGLSFTYDTPVATQQGPQKIGKLKLGEKVWAYNPQTKKMELQPVLHIWINHDTDLEDLTIATTDATKNGKIEQQTYETIHTNKKHPFLTQEYGFLPVADLHVGMHIVKADGSLGEIFAWKLVVGSGIMYNLTVNEDHTYTVGDNSWIVHNENCNASATAIAAQIFRDMRNMGADMTNRTIAVGLSEDHIPIVSINEIDGAGEDLTAKKLAGLVEEKYDFMYTGPSEKRRVWPFYELLDHADVSVINAAERENITLSGLGSATRAPCPICQVNMEFHNPDLVP